MKIIRNPTYLEGIHCRGQKRPHFPLFNGIPFSINCLSQGYSISFVDLKIWREFHFLYVGQRRWPCNPSCCLRGRGCSRRTVDQSWKWHECSKQTASVTPARGRQQGTHSSGKETSWFGMPPKLTGEYFSCLLFSVVAWRFRGWPW